MSRFAWDAVIVGAGPSGASLAALLARRGWRVALVDAAAFPRQKVCGEYLSPTVWPALVQLGVATQVRQRAVRLSRLRITLPGGRGIAMACDASAGQALAVSRYLLDDLLVRQARAAGAVAFFGHRVTDVLIDGGRAGGVIAAPLERPRQKHTLTAPLVVAADGRQSVVVRATGRVRRREGRLVGFKRHVCLSGPAAAELAETLEMFSLSGGYVGVTPVEGDAVNICGLIPRTRVRHARGCIQRALSDWAVAQPRLLGYLAGRPLGPWYTMPDVSPQRAWPLVSGVLYVGDACGTVEPLAGQGMTLGLFGAVLAADFLGDVPPDGVDRAGQTAYFRRWHRTFDQRIRLSGCLGWLLKHPAVCAPLLPSRPLGGGWRWQLARHLYGKTFVPWPLAPAASLVG